MAKSKYDIKIGLQKTGKNLVVMFALPALIYFLENLTGIVPDGYLPIVIPIASAMSYALKNYIENK